VERDERKVNIRYELDHSLLQSASAFEGFHHRSSGTRAVKSAHNLDEMWLVLD
jgi:hypothetical protein